MSTLPNPASARAYPIPAPADDRRFTLGLVLDVANLLADRGFPRVESGGDLVALQQAIYSFIYAPAAHTAARSVCLGAPAGVEADCGRPGPHAEHPIEQPPAVAE